MWHDDDIEKCDGHCMTACMRTEISPHLINWEEQGEVRWRAECSCRLVLAWGPHYQQVNVTDPQLLKRNSEIDMKNVWLCFALNEWNVWHWIKDILGKKCSTLILSIFSKVLNCWMLGFQLSMKFNIMITEYLNSLTAAGCPTSCLTSAELHQVLFRSRMFPPAKHVQQG